MGINKSARGNKRSDATAVEMTRLARIKYPDPGYSVLRIYYPPDKVYGDKIYCYTGIGRMIRCDSYHNLFHDICIQIDS